jgi:hypothetical protein
MSNNARYGPALSPCWKIVEEPRVLRWFLTDSNLLINLKGGIAYDFHEQPLH